VIKRDITSEEYKSFESTANALNARTMRAFENLITFSITKNQADLEVQLVKLLRLAV